MTQIFKKEVSTKTSAVVFGVLIIACLFAFYVSAAWNEPTQPPPAGNVPAPINTGTTDQIKSGGLKVEGVFSAPTVYDSNDPNYYININGMAVLAGPVGIGPTSTPSHQLEVAGVVKFGSTSQPTQDITNGLMYYDQTLNKFRCYQNGWVDCIGSAGGVISNKGLQKVGNDFGIKNCAADQIVKYNASGQWDCAADETGAGGGITCGGTCSANQVAFFTSGTAISSDAGLFWDNINKRLGVGTQNPHIDLDIESDNSTSYTGVEITNIDVSTRRWAMLVSNNAGSYAPSKGFAIRDISVGSTRLVIDTSGKIGVGTITPAYKLDISGGDINTSGVYRQGGINVGTSKSCQPDEVLKGATVNGGIVTGGTCLTDETGAGAVPSGVIVMWSGSAANIPTGWALCDGNNGTPNLRNRFIVGAGSSYNPGDTGGATNHRHVYTTTSTAGQGYNPEWTYDSSPQVPQFSHTHSGTTGYADNLPPYYALCYIMKL